VPEQSECRIGRAVAIVLAVAGLTVAAGNAATPRFSARVTNPWFPLKPGTTWIYRGTKDGKPTRDVVVATHRVRTIEGARCVVVTDSLYEAGRLEERTSDYYTQDRAGNVWYFGEDTAELTPQGKVKTTEGTWLAGRDGAKPGIYFPAHPRVGEAGRQEFYKGQAEDHFRVVRVNATTVVTHEWTPLEPGVLDEKVYRRNVGTVKEVTLHGPLERNVLVSKRP
jgi:hypothetical protein